MKTVHFKTIAPALGLSIALAALTRPTMLAIVPFLVLAAGVKTKGASLGQRATQLAFFLTPLAAPLLVWNLVWVRSLILDFGAFPITPSW